MRLTKFSQVSYAEHSIKLGKHILKVHYPKEEDFYTRKIYSYFSFQTGHLLRDGLQGGSLIEALWYI